MASKGSTYRAEANITLRTACVHCGKSIPTEVGSAHPLDEAVRRETYGLVGDRGGKKAIFATCTACHETGWRPARFIEHDDRWPRVAPWRDR